MDPALTERWLLVPAAGPRAGLGHLRRCAALEVFAPDAIGHSEASLLSPEQRRRLWATIIGEQNVSWVILDGYDFTAEDQRASQATGRQLLVIDDHQQLEDYHADMIVNPNAGAEEIIYRGSPVGRRLQGADFAIIAPDILSARRNQFDIHRVATRILVTTGGGNPQGARERVIEALGQVETEPLEITLVIGPQDREGAVDVPSNSRHRWSIARSPAEMARLMIECDLAISTAGVTLAELAYLGVPTIAVIAAENQQRGAWALAKAGAIENAGEIVQITAEKLRRLVESLLRDERRRRNLSENSQWLIDGAGARRIARAIRDLTIRLRPANEGDLTLLFDWVNDPAVRQASFHSDTIELAAHIRWLRQRLADPQSTMYMADDGAQLPLGQVRFQRAGDEAAISISVAAEQRGKHRGTRLIHLACRRYFFEHGVKAIVAQIKPTNEASLKTFQKVGFQFAGETRINEQPATTWRLTRDGWT